MGAPQCHSDNITTATPLLSKSASSALPPPPFRLPAIPSAGYPAWSGAVPRPAASVPSRGGATDPRPRCAPLGFVPRLHRHRGVPRLRSVPLAAVEVAPFAPRLVAPYGQARALHPPKGAGCRAFLERQRTRLWAKGFASALELAVQIGVSPEPRRGTATPTSPLRADCPSHGVTSCPNPALTVSKSFNTEPLPQPSRPVPR